MWNPVAVFGLGKTFRLFYQKIFYDGIVKEPRLFYIYHMPTVLHHNQLGTFMSQNHLLDSGQK
jgi:hypothetical protein